MKYNEISHFSHPQHKLHFEHTHVPFRCDGCKEMGIGSRYKCSSCSYDLHMNCALSSNSSTLCHPFYPKCTFQFMARPPGKFLRYCNACERDVRGYVYHCNSCGFDLHPCCAKLPMVLHDAHIKLYLYRKVSAPCMACGRKGRSWSYRSSDNKYNLHVACVKDMLADTSHGGAWVAEQKKGSTKKGNLRRYCEAAGTGVQFVLSAVLGDPTALIAGAIGLLLSR